MDLETPGDVVIIDILAAECCDVEQAEGKLRPSLDNRSTNTDPIGVVTDKIAVGLDDEGAILGIADAGDEGDEGCCAAFRSKTGEECAKSTITDAGDEGGCCIILVRFDVG